MFRPFKISTLTALFALLIVFSGQQLWARPKSPNLKESVQAALERYYDELPVEITIKDAGRVTLKGHLKNLAEQEDVYQIVSRVAGVKEIDNQIVVIPEVVSDPVVTANIENFLKSSGLILVPNEVKVAAKSGAVTLTGKVNSNRESKAAERIAAMTKGVGALKNELQVVPHGKDVSDSDLSNTLRDLLTDNFPNEAGNIKVQVESGQVTMSGWVSRLYLRREIGSEVERIGGVRGLKNDLIVM